MAGGFNRMYQHHRDAIESITCKLKTREEILGIIVAGSVAHGFGEKTSDIDLMLVLSDEDYEKALKSGEIGYYETEATPYEGGYVDGKFTSAAYIEKVAQCGTEPAKFAFRDAFLSFARIEGLEQLIANASRYPMEKKKENIERFHAQLEAWKWYYHESLKRNNLYLADVSLSNFILFAGRLILTHNEVLYPHYKWFLKVLDEVRDKPENLMLQIGRLRETKTKDSLDALYQTIESFQQWVPAGSNWSRRYMLDSELNWLQGNVPVADI
jgi:predicted nucleotidyltransferase